MPAALRYSGAVRKEAKLPACVAALWANWEDSQGPSGPVPRPAQLAPGWGRPPPPGCFLPTVVLSLGIPLVLPLLHF